MKEKIYTIPINEAYDIKCGCPLCRLHDDLNKQSVEYVMGAAMMEPDVRIETNKLGFCSKHFSDMLKVKNRLGLALIIESHLDQLKKEIFDKRSAIFKKTNIEKTISKMKENRESCFICNQVENRLKAYFSNIIYLWQTEEEFREKSRKQEYFCLEHLTGLIEIAQKELDKKAIILFVEDHIAVSGRHMEVLTNNISTFCKSFDHRFSDMPLGEAKNAVEHTMEFLTGK